MSDPTWTLSFQGAEARVYFGTYNNMPAVKKDRFVKRYRHPDLDQQLRRLRTRAEVRSLARVRDKCKKLEHLIPKVLSHDEGSGQIIMEEVVGGVAIVDVIREQGQSAAQDSDNIFQSMGAVIAQIHAAGIVHGDLTTSNLLIKGTDVIPIDWGLSSSSTSAEDRAVDLYVLERALLSSEVSEVKFSILMASYRRELGKLIREKDVESVIRKLDDVRSRGRKRSMAG